MSLAYVMDGLGCYPTSYPAPDEQAYQCSTCGGVRRSRGVPVCAGVGSTPHVDVRMKCIDLDGAPADTEGLVTW